jgi:hypothetical protein
MKRITQEAIPAAPPFTVTSLTFFGVALQDWVYLLTIFYTMVLLFRLFFPRQWVSLVNRLSRESV